MSIYYHCSSFVSDLLLFDVRGKCRGLIGIQSILRLVPVLIAKKGNLCFVSVGARLVGTRNAHVIAERNTRSAMALRMGLDSSLPQSPGIRA